MLGTLKKLLYIFSFNTSLLFILLIGIQNSQNKSKVNLIISETIELPISFIIGASFISGSFLGSFFSIKYFFSKK